MTFKEKRRLIEAWVKIINERLGENYELDYVACYGGFKLYKKGGGPLMENYRRDADNMLSYLGGILNACLYLPF